MSEELELVETQESEETEVISEALSPERIDSVIESILFVSQKPIGLLTIKQAFKGAGVKKEQVKESLERLSVKYASGNCGVALEQVAGGYQLRTKLDNTRYLRNMGKTKSFRLTGPSLETLAIIAYREPLTKFEIDQIRGVESGHLVRALMEKGLVMFAGKSDVAGKPMQYATTKKFLEIFGLRNLKELPSLSEIDDLIPEGITEAEGDKLTLDQVTEKLGNAIDNEYSKGEEQLQDIVSELETISTSTEFFETEKNRQREKRDRERAEDIRESVALGQPTDPKDIKWLEKYESAMKPLSNSTEVVGDNGAQGI